MGFSRQEDWSGVPLPSPRQGWGSGLSEVLPAKARRTDSFIFHHFPSCLSRVHSTLEARQQRRLGAAVCRAPFPGRASSQLMGSWYVLAVASGGKDFALERATRSVEGVEVMLTSQNTLKMRASRHRLERCHLQAVELRRQNSGWVFGNPSLGVLEYRVLGTNFRDYAIVFTQLEAQEEAFSTVELYSRTALASQEALGRFAKWSRSLGFLSQQQAELQRDFTCARKVFP
ncbi:epididymal-specific lipocalin-6 isoform X9 [Ovis canadensis]|uniref:epididymal-specific lipocalin-6 isoform X9 n=1 Tax=Ovis canadensis TaxID=37174 RepID=UPI003753AE34